jgi:hypothetical protein
MSSPIQVRKPDTFWFAFPHSLFSPFSLVSNCAELNGDCVGVIRRVRLSSEIIKRTHEHRPTNKREPLFRSNHRRRGPLVRCLNKQGNSKMSNANQSHLNKNLAHQQNDKEQIDTGTASFDIFPGGFQAIATAYGDYTKKSFEDTKLFVEKLSGVKSLDKAIEVQTEFAKTAYETFVTESQKIAALYSDLAKQSYKPFGGFVAKMTSTNR